MSGQKMIEEVYTGAVTSRGGRGGEGESSDGALKVNYVSPDKGEEGTNPEQLFAAAYAACYESALRQHAKSEDIKPEDVAVTAHVTLGKTAGDDFQLGVRLEAKAAGIERAQLEDLMKRAHQTCPYSRATRGNIDVELVAK